MMSAYAYNAETSRRPADVELIRRTAEAVGAELQPRCVILFGSRARGEHRPNSDVDLAIIVGPSQLDARQRHERQCARSRGSRWS